MVAFFCLIVSKGTDKLCVHNILLYLFKLKKIWQLNLLIF